MRRPALVLPALLLLTLPGCGGDDDDDPAPRPSAAPTPTTAVPPKAQEVPLEGPRAAAVARSIVLRSSDLPGLEADDVDPSDDADDPLAACLDGPGTALATSESAGFSKGAPPAGYVVGSSTEVVATTQEGVEDFAALTAPSVLSCLQEAASTAFGGDVEGTFARVPTTAPPGADGAARYVLTGTAGEGREAFAVQLGLSAVLVGRAEISVYDIGYGKAGLPGKERDRLIGLLVRRAQSAQHLDGF